MVDGEPRTDRGRMISWTEQTNSIEIVENAVVKQIFSVTFPAVYEICA
jgi:hypothetical protein